ncbi:MAG: HD domain-containing phosphohydrolase [Candidatus Melainabacteria bacterium]
MNSRVLIVDDEENILHTMHRVFRKDDIEIITTHVVSDAIAMIQEKEFAVVISDHRMPEMSGTRFLEQVRKTCPDTIRILLTGYADIQSAVEAINQGAVYQFISKPWNPEHLKLVLGEAIRQYNMGQENKVLQTMAIEKNKELSILNKEMEQIVQERTEEVERLNTDLQQSFDATVQIIARLAELHSDAITSHASRVAKLSVAVGQYLKLPAHELQQLELAAKLHDIGKINIPIEILNKPEAEWTPSETDRVRRHAAQGEALVAMIPGFEEAARYVRHHHEHFDGTGYPDQKQKHGIPMGARIIAAVNLFDKDLHPPAGMTGTVDKALARVKSRAGNVLDPAVVEALIRVAELPANQMNRECSITVQQLQTGMVLSRDLVTQKGILILCTGTELTDTIVQRVQAYLMKDPPATGIYIHQ